MLIKNSIMEVIKKSMVFKKYFYKILFKKKLKEVLQKLLPITGFEPARK